MKSTARSVTCNCDHRLIGSKCLRFGSVVAILTAFASLTLAATPDNWVPLPQPKPTELSGKGTPAEGIGPSAEPDAGSPVAEGTKPTQPSACRLALTEDLAVALDQPDINEEGGCGGTDLVKLEAVVLPDRRKVPLQPAAVLRCSMARAVVDWVRVDLTAIARGMNSAVSGLDNFNSYECRGRNRVSGAKLSEHGKANALDLRQIRLTNGAVIALTDSFSAREPREKVQASICERFDTVLGPGSDGYHEDHIHIDLAARRSGYKICQWSIEDGMPARPPVLPVARPAEAPTAVASTGSVKPDPDHQPIVGPQPAPPVSATDAAVPVAKQTHAATRQAEGILPQGAATPLPVPAPARAKVASVADQVRTADRPRKPRKRNDGQTLPSPLQLLQMLR